MTGSITKLTSGEQAAVMRWPEILGIGIIQAYTKTKTVDLIGWPTLDFTKVDFKANLANGLYDLGIALRTGTTITGNKYLVVLDFDGWEAVIAWFGSWDSVLALSKKTLVEWHQDQGKIHVFLFSAEPLLSRKIHIKNAYLEVRCQNEEGVGQLVFASPSIHKEGSPYCALGTDLVEEMQPIELLRLKSKISQLCEDYMSDLDKDKYDAMLDESGLKLGVNGGRHDATLFKAMRNYFKYSGEWLDLTDEQRFERAWEWHLAHCDPPRSKKEFDNICDWIVKNLRQKRDQLHGSERLKRNQARQQRQQTSKGKEEKKNGDEDEDEDKSPEIYQKFQYTQFYIDLACFAEAVIIGRIPHFAVVNNTTNQISLIKEIVIDTEWDEEGHVTKQLVYKPSEGESYINKPYTFESEGDFFQLIDFVKNEEMCTLDGMYYLVKSIWTKYIDADDDHVSICAADTIFSYFQDIVGITHYLFFVGDNDSGKSNNLVVFHFLGYRNMMSVGISVANIYQFLGSGEEGIGTICEDEANQIDEDRDKMELAKSGYTKGYPVVKTTISNNGERYQKKYNTFCMKLYSAEKAPDAIKGKGIIQRMVKLRCIAGEPAHDILEVVNPMGDDEHSDLLKELHRVRNMLLCYRLVHRNDKISNITINLKNREKQLFKPVLRLFQNTKTMPQLSIVISNYINERRKTKLSGLHSFLIQLVDDMMTDKGYGNIGVALAEKVELDTSDIWTKVQTRTSGQFQPGHPLTYETVEFGPVSQKQVTGILEDVFKAEIRNSNGTRKVVFMRKNLEKVRLSYDISDVVVSVSAIPKSDTTTAEGTEKPGKND